MVDKVWKLRTLFQGKMVVDLVHSRDSSYLRIRLISFSPSQSLDQCKIEEGGKIIPLRSTLSIKYLERSSSSI